MTDRAWRQMHDWPIVGARRPGWMDEPEVVRERSAEEREQLFTEWEWERDKLANLTSEEAA